MRLSKWIEKHSTEKLRKLAKMCGCANNYLYHVSFNGCSPGLAIKIERATATLTPDKVVHKWELRNDIWEKPKSETK